VIKNVALILLAFDLGFIVEMGKNPQCLSLVLFGFYQISGFVRFGFFPATEKWKFGSGSVLCAKSSVLFRSVLCGFLVYMFTIYIEYTMWVKKNPPEVFSHFPPKQLGIFSQNFTCLLFFLSTLDYNFFFNYLQLWWSHAILSATTQHAYRPMVDILSIWCELGGNWIKICSLA